MISSLKSPILYTSYDSRRTQSCRREEKHKCTEAIIPRSLLPAAIPAGISSQRECCRTADGGDHGLRPCWAVSTAVLWLLLHKNVSEYLERFARSSLKSEVCSLCSQFVFAVCVCSLCRRDRATIGVYSI